MTIYAARPPRTFFFYPRVFYRRKFYEHPGTRGKGRTEETEDCRPRVSVAPSLAPMGTIPITAKVTAIVSRVARARFFRRFLSFSREFAKTPKILLIGRVSFF